LEGVGKITQQASADLCEDPQKIEDLLYQANKDHPELEMTYSEFLVFMAAIAQKVIEHLRTQGGQPSTEATNNYDATLLNSALHRIDELEARLEANARDVDELVEPIFVKSPWG
jgi:phosphoserine aminotransferase